MIPKRNRARMMAQMLNAGERKSIGGILVGTGGWLYPEARRFAEKLETLQQQPKALEALQSQAFLVAEKLDHDAAARMIATLLRN